jgi:hypothetical protein
MSKPPQPVRLLLLVLSQLLVLLWCAVARLGRLKLLTKQLLQYTASSRYMDLKMKHS